MPIGPLAAIYADLPQSARARGASWRDRADWSLADAMLWVVYRRAGYVKALVAYSAFASEVWPSAVAVGSTIDVMQAALAGADTATAANLLLKELRDGRIAAHGRLEGRGPPVDIDPKTWAAVSMPEAHAWSIGSSDGGQIWFTDLRLSGSDILASFPEQLSSPPVVHDDCPPAPIPKRRGPRGKWDWIGASAAIHEWDGLDDVLREVVEGVRTQASIERYMTDWFADRNEGNHPHEGDIRAHVKPIIDARRESLARG